MRALLRACPVAMLVAASLGACNSSTSPPPPIPVIDAGECRTNCTSLCLENCSCAFQVATAQGGCVNNCAADPSLCGVVTDAMVADARIDATPDAGEPFYFCECKGLPSCSGNTYLAVPAAACKSEVFPVPCETVTYAFCAGGTVYDACRCDVPAGWVQEGLDGGNDTGADSAPDVSTPSDASDGG